jgi:hypothetical protein
MLGGRNIFQASRNDFQAGRNETQAGRNKIQARRNKNKIDFLPQFEFFQWVPPLFGVVRHSSLLPPGRSSGSGAASDEHSATSVFCKQIEDY